MSFTQVNARMQADNAALGIGAMLISVTIFAIMDALVKWLSSIYPTQQIMFFRFLAALFPVVVLLYLRGGVRILSVRKPLLHALRSAVGMCATAFAFHGFSLMRLADAVSILHTTPLFMIVLSVLLLGERVGIRRWSAVVLGFVGMLIVVRPGEGVLDSGSFYMLLAALCIACSTILVRRLSATDDPVAITFYFTLSGAMVSAIACLHFGWIVPPLNDLAMLMAVGLLGGCAQYAMTLAYRHAEVGLVAPLQYLSIVAAGVIGFAVWLEVPDRQSMVGIGIIIAAGLYTLHREARLMLLQNRGQK